MATVTYVFTINHVAKKLGEDPELLEAIVSNDDNLSYGSIISVVHGDDETITALTDDGIDELRQMLADARRSPEAWNDLLDCFVDEEEVHRSRQGEISAVTIGRLRSGDSGVGGKRNREAAGRQHCSSFLQCCNPFRERRSRTFAWTAARGYGNMRFVKNWLLQSCPQGQAHYYTVYSINFTERVSWSHIWFSEFKTRMSPFGAFVAKSVVKRRLLRQIFAKADVPAVRLGGFVVNVTNCSTRSNLFRNQAYAKASEKRSDCALDPDSEPLIDGTHWLG